MIVGTTTEPMIMEEMGFGHIFTARYEVPLVEGSEQIKTVLDELGFEGNTENIPPASIPIKQLIMAADIAETGRPLDECFDMLGIDY